MEDNKSVIKKYLLFWVIGIIIMPILINYLIINNNFFSKAGNDGWASFWGSYLGAIFSGIITLIVMYVTIIDGRKNTKKAIDFNRYMQFRNEKIALTNEIANLIGEYCQDISKYHYECKEGERNREYKRKLYDQKYNGYISIEEYSQKMTEIMHEERRADRSKSIAILYTIRIKLKNIDLAKELVKQLEHIHKSAYENDNDSFEDEIHILQNKATRFIELFLEEKHGKD